MLRGDLLCTALKQQSPPRGGGGVAWNRESTGGGRLTPGGSEGSGNGLWAGLADWWARRWRAGGAALLLLCLAVYLPGLMSLPPVDRDESRFAQASRQMLESGDLVMPRVQDRPRLNKPPLIYWAQSLSARVLGDSPGAWNHGNIWVFRVPSVLAAIGSVLLTWRLGLRMVAPSAAWLGAAFLAVSPMVVWDAHQARADQLLLFTVVLMQFALHRVWIQVCDGGRGEGWRWPMIFWLAFGAGVLTKGPIAPMIGGLTVLGLCWSTRSWRLLWALRPQWGGIVVVACVAPWVVLLTTRLAHAPADLRAELGITGPGTGSWIDGFRAYASVVYEETLGRSAGAKEGHAGPPGYHLVLLTALLWPGSMLTGLGLGAMWNMGFPRREFPIGASWFRRTMHRLRTPLDAGPGGHARFLLMWVVPSWVVFEVVSTKLPHYTMPLYPALAVISGWAVVQAQRGELAGLGKRSTRVGLAIWLTVGMAITLGAPLGVAIAGQGGALRDAAAWSLRMYGFAFVVLAVLLVAIGRAMQQRIGRGAWIRAAGLAIGAAILAEATLLHMVLPRAERFWISSRVMTVVQSDDRSPPIDRVFAGEAFREDSLVFFSRGRLTLLEGAGKADLQRRTAMGQRVVVIGNAAERAALDIPTIELGEVSGLNYVNGKRLHLLVLEPVRE